MLNIVVMENATEEVNLMFDKLFECSMKFVLQTV